MRTQPALALLLVLAAARVAQASPEGTEYRVHLDGDVTNGAVSGVEGHAALVLFDGLPDPLPNDLPPPAPLAPGNDLWVDEQATPLAGGRTAVEIHIFGSDGTPNPPAPGSAGVIFVNPLDVPFPVLLDVSEFRSGSGTPMAISALAVKAATGAGTPQPIDFEIFDVSGTGTSTSSFTILLDVESAALATATSLRLSFRIGPVQQVDALSDGYLLAAGLLMALAARRLAPRSAY